LLGEKPAANGVAGVLVMTAGAYALNLVSGKGNSKVLEKVMEREAAAAAAAGGLGAATANSKMSGSGKGGAKRAAEDPTGSDGGIGSAFSSSSDMVGGLTGGIVGGGLAPMAGAVAESPCVRGILCMLPAEPGSRLMLLVAIIWSLTSDLDKMGKQAASSFLVFLAVQRLCMGIPLVTYLVCKQGVGKSLRTFYTCLGFLLVLAVVEMYTVAAYLKALNPNP
jgi:hypothetical protein